MAFLSAPADASAAALRKVAIEWMVTLCSGEAGPADIARHREWLRSDVRHQRAWAEIEAGMGAALAPLKGDRAARQIALVPPPTRRRALLGLAALAGSGAGAAWLAHRQGLADAWLADLRTGTGERREVALEDGSRLLLNADSAVDVSYGDAQRLVILHAGALVATAVSDSRREFVVRTAQGEVRTRGAQVLVRQDADSTLAGSLAHEGRVHARSGVQARLEEGRALRLLADRIDAVQAAPAQLAAWRRGMLLAEDLPLGEVVDQLRPYRAGIIRVSGRAAALRVLGAFPLDDPDHVLDSLAQTLPVRVVRYGAWFVALRAKDEG